MFLKPLCLGVALVFATALADTKAEGKPALSGTWAKKDGELKIKFGDGSAKFFLHGDKPDKLIVVVCDCKAEKGGVVQAEVTGFEGKEEIKKVAEKRLPLGLKFSFRWSVKGGTGKLADFKGDKAPEIFKTHLEGDFKKE